MSLRSVLRNLRGKCAFPGCPSHNDWRVVASEPKRLMNRLGDMYWKRVCQRHANELLFYAETDLLGTPTTRTPGAYKQYCGRGFKMDPALTGQNYDYNIWVNVSSDGRHHLAQFLTLDDANRINKVWGVNRDQVIVPYTWQPSSAFNEPEVLLHDYDENIVFYRDRYGKVLSNWLMRTEDFQDPTVWLEEHDLPRVPAYIITDEEVDVHLQELGEMEAILQVEE